MVMMFEVITVVADENTSLLGCNVILAGFLGQLDADVGRQGNIRQHFSVFCGYPVRKILVLYLGMTLCYKSEGRWFDSRWCHWNFSLI